MQIQVTHVEVHSPEQVRAILKAATAIANELTDDPDDWRVIFSESCRLLGMRASVSAPAPALPLDMSLAGLRSR